MRFDAVIFDWEGVLVEMDRGLAASFFRNRATKSVKGLTQRWEAWCADHLGGIRDANTMWSTFWREVAAEVGISETALEEVCAFDGMSLFRPWPDAKEALVRARELGLRIGVLSNSALPKLESTTAPLPLHELVDVIRVPGRGASVKPERQAYLEIVEQLGTTPDRCLYFDDEPRFVEAGRAARLSGYVVTRGEGALSPALPAVRDLSCLSALVGEAKP